jgi:hypothetical protein
MLKIIAVLFAFLPLSMNTSCHLPTGTNGNADIANNGQNTTISTQNSKKKGKIQVALLLDTSNSMDGLIDQAKSQIWKMVNRLAAAKKNDEATDIEIALFEYGNDNLEMGEGYVRMISSLTSDVDAISEKLFALKTKGGSEYCGWVIGDAVGNLKWSDNNDDLKLIIIAGNEPFDQGPKDYKETCKSATKKDIVINTVHCGPWQEGIRTHWKDGADIAKGKYLNIEQDKKVIHIKTPWDERMYELNGHLNKTYIGYGSVGKDMKARQEKQDVNASEYGSANAASRTAYKAKAQYRNDSWDLVDATEKDGDKVATMKTEELPEEMKKMSVEERKIYIEKLRKVRTDARKEIQELEKKIAAFTAEETLKQGDNLTLDKVMQDAVVEQAKEKGFVFEKN